MLNDLVIGLALGLMLFSPFIFLVIGRIKLALLNGSFLVFNFISWFNALAYKGAFEINFATTAWLLFIVINISFLLVAFSQAMTKVFSLEVRTLMITGCVTFVVCIIGFITFGRYHSSLDYYFHFGFYFVTVYLIGALITGLVGIVGKRAHNV